MKITCLQENLNFGLQNTGHLANKNINLPILNNVLIEAKDGGVKLSSTNLEVGISCNVRCKTEIEGSFTVDAKLFSEYINLLPNEQVEINLEENDYLHVSCKNYETKLKGIVADDFPVIPIIEKKEAYKIKIDEFKKALSQVVFAVSVSESRPEIAGVYINFNKTTKGQMILAGTDSYRLAERSLGLVSGQEENEVIVPLKTLQEVLRILNNIKENAGENEDLEIYLSENQILFVANGIELISRLIEGQYPDYRQIIPQESKTNITVSTSELVKTIKTVALFSKVGIFDITIEFSKTKGLTLKALNSQTGESKSEVEVEFSGEDNQTVLNYRYLLDGLNNINADEVEICLVDGNVPCVFRPKGKKNYTYIVMPIKQ